MLLDHLALELQAGCREVAGPGEDLHFGVLIDAIALAGGERNHVALGVRAVEQELRVEEVSFLRRHEPADTAVQHHVGIHELDRNEAEVRIHGVRETLNGLEGCHVHAPVGIVDHDQIRAVLAAHELGPERVEVLLDVCCRGSRAPIRSGVERLVAPEIPGSAVDASDSASGRGSGDLGLETGDFLAAVAGAVAVNAAGNQIGHGRFGHRDAPLEQVDDLFLASILELLQAADGDGASRLLDVVLRSADDVLRSHRKRFVPAVVTGVGVFGERKFLHDDVTAAELLDVSARFQATEQGVVLGDVVGNDAGTVLDGGADDVADARIGKGHGNLLFRLRDCWLRHGGLWNSSYNWFGSLPECLGNGVSVMESMPRPDDLFSDQ